MTVNAGFKSSRQNQKKPPLQDNRDDLSNLNKILDRICQIHSTPGKPANHTHRDCWVFKQSGRLNAEHKGLDTPQGRTPKAEYRETKEFPTRSKNSKLTPHNKTCGAHKGTRPTVYPKGIPPLVVKTNHLRSSGLF